MNIVKALVLFMKRGVVLVVAIIILVIILVIIEHIQVAYAADNQDEQGKKVLTPTLVAGMKIEFLVPEDDMITLVIDHVACGGPAAEAGLIKDDILLAIDGESVHLKYSFKDSHRVAMALSRFTTEPEGTAFRIKAKRRDSPVGEVETILFTTRLFENNNC